MLQLIMRRVVSVENMNLYKFIIFSSLLTIHYITSYRKNYVKCCSINIAQGKNNNNKS